MWIFLNNAMISVVRQDGDPRMLVARARFRGDLEKVFQRVKVHETPDRDYRFRCFVTPDAFAAVMYREAMEIDYHNFKDSVRDRDRHDVYLDVWRVMFRAQQEQNPPSAIGRTRRRGAPPPPPPLPGFETGDIVTGNPEERLSTLLPSERGAKRRQTRA